MKPAKYALLSFLSITSTTLAVSFLLYINVAMAYTSKQSSIGQALAQAFSTNALIVGITTSLIISIIVYNTSAILSRSFKKKRFEVIIIYDFIFTWLLLLINYVMGYLSQDLTYVESIRKILAVQPILISFTGGILISITRVIILSRGGDFPIQGIVLSEMSSNNPSLQTTKRSLLKNFKYSNPLFDILLIFSALQLNVAMGIDFNEPNQYLGLIYTTTVLLGITGSLLFVGFQIWKRSCRKFFFHHRLLSILVPFAPARVDTYKEQTAQIFANVEPQKSDNDKLRILARVNEHSENDKLRLLRQSEVSFPYIRPTDQIRDTGIPWQNHVGTVGS